MKVMTHHMQEVDAKADTLQQDLDPSPRRPVQRLMIVMVMMMMMLMMMMTMMMMMQKIAGVDEDCITLV